MEFLIQWWQGFTTVQQIYLFAAIPATVILILQTILLLLGVGFGNAMDHGEGLDDFNTPDFDGDGTDIQMDAPDIHGEGFDLESDAVEMEMAGTDIEVEHPDLSAEGMDEGGGVYEPDGAQHDGAHHASGLRILTVRGIVAFFAVGGWLGVAMLDIGLSVGLSALIAILGGCASLVLVALALKWSLSLQYSGNIQTQNAIDKIGEVYLKIPPKGKGKGKVNLLLQERYVEMEAVTNSYHPIKVGQRIVVTGLVDQNTLLVEPAKTELDAIQYKEVSNNKNKLKK